MHGVRQGLVLGPLLFLIYINDLYSSIQFCKIFHFADGTNLLHIGKSTKKVQKEINKDLKTLYQWMLSNMISLKKDKTEMLIFHTKGTSRPFLKV